jgi:hypothetical protein
MTQEKRLIVDLMCLHQAYKRREIMEVKWISGGNNPADAMTKVKLCQAFKTLININKLNLQVIEWVKRDWWSTYSLFTAHWKTVQFTYGPLEGSLDGTSGGFLMYFLLCFTVVLKQLRRLYTGGSIFQIPPVSDCSTCCTNPIYTCSVHQLYLHVRCTNYPLTRLVHLLIRGRRTSI